MSKECLQLSVPEAKRTTCFKVLGGGRPCSGPDCLVAKEMESCTQNIPAVRELIMALMFHDICRMSDGSKNNGEFWERIRDKYHLLIPESFLNRPR